MVKNRDSYGLMDIMLYISIAVIGIFIYIKFFKSNTESTGIPKRSAQKYQTIDDEFNAKRKAKQERIDRILEKINEKGVDSLTSKEKALLDEYSNAN
ncbi:hypothetical protein EZY14_004750 [Kordia sp. TARA_039_SRF]|nr:hypothetical protein EZY14_004750 [Kordia sp. TARA_039_SRF]